MRAAPALLALLVLVPGLALAALPALPNAGVPPAVNALLPATGPFQRVTCPFLASPQPLRPLEVCNVRATAQTGPGDEIDMGMNPADPDHLVVAAKGFNASRLLTTTGTGGVITPYATSFDGGITWTEGYLQDMVPVITLPDGTALGDTPNLESDPVVEFAADGAPLIMTLRVNQDRGLPVYRSADGGRTFTQISKAYPTSTDKEWMVTDPVTGNIYAGTLHSGGIGFVKSTDHGFTWSAAQRVMGGSYVSLDTGPQGQIYMASNSGSTVQFTRSLDQGATWEAQRTIGPRAATGVPCGLRLFRTPDFAQVAASRSTPDVWVVVVLKGSTLPDVGSCPETPDWGIFVMHSPDAGVTWGPPVRVDDGLPAFRAMPEIAVSPNGRDLHVTWLDQRNDPTGVTFQIFYAHSPDGGAAWEANVQVTDQASPAWLTFHQSLVNGPFVGDYFAISATDDKAVIAFPDERYGRADIYVATIV